MLTGVSSCAVVTEMALERYTHWLMDASPEFPIHFLKIYSGKEYHCSSPASRREDLQGEAPVACRDGASVDFHPTLASVRGAALLGPQVVEVRQPRAPPL